MTEYWCPACQEHHRETLKVDYTRAIREDRCSAQYKQPAGGWRVCHASFALVGGPNLIGKARLCDPCWHRQVVRPGLDLAADKRFQDSAFRLLRRPGR